MREVAIAGIGMTRFARQPELSLRELSALAVDEAVKGSNLETEALEGAFVANALGGAITFQEMVAGQVVLRNSGISQIPVVNVENACASASTALHLAWQTVASGAADIVLAVGVERMSHPDKAYALAAIGRAADVEAVFGPEGPQPGKQSYFMEMYAGLARDQIATGRVEKEDFARVAVKNRRHGSLNPLAQFGEPMTLEEVMEAREIVEPLTLPMCSPVSDGAAAVVVATPDVVKDLGLAPVHIRASVLTSGTPSSVDAPSSTERAAEKAYGLAGIGPDRVDLIELHDAAAAAEVSIYESLGIAKKGEGAEILRAGVTELGGDLPVNVSGGLLSKGHPIGATGLAQIVEITRHLRGEAGERQVEGARWGLTQNGGGWIDGDNAAVAVHILEGEGA